MQTLITIILLFAAGTYLLVSNPTVKEVARWVTGIACVVLGILLVLS